MNAALVRVNCLTFLEYHGTSLCATSNINIFSYVKDLLILLVYMEQSNSLIIDVRILPNV